jgi:DNA-binding PadR family transcriptional regulator
MKDWKAPAGRESIERTLKALQANGLQAVLAADAAEARRQVLALVPAGSEVFTMVSITLEESGLAKALNEPGRYDSIRNKLAALNPQTQEREMRKLCAAPDFAVGSVHAVTEDGRLLIASNTGSQLGAYAYSAGRVIWVIGAQKIVRDLEEGMQRLREHVLGLETARARKAYGLPESWNSYYSKILTLNREINPGRAQVVLVNQALGF